mgnify:CR=1 FL=1
MIYKGSCHCGAVAFEVEANEKVVAISCNCSICTKAGNLHMIVPRSKFKLIKGEIIYRPIHLTQEKLNIYFVELVA